MNLLSWFSVCSSVYDPAFCAIVGTELHGNLIARKNANLVHAQFTRYIPHHFFTVLETQLETKTGQRFQHLSLAQEAFIGFFHQLSQNKRTVFIYHRG